MSFPSIEVHSILQGTVRKGGRDAGSDRQPESFRPVHPLGMVPDVAGESRRDPRDARGVRHRHPPALPQGEAAVSAGEGRMWTARLRGAAVRALPPERLLPDKQPAYVSSWIYVFGVLTLTAFIVVLVSGAVLALEGPSWWHTSKIGLFFNSLHLWSVELFMAFMVIHLWGKFFMAAWRGRRALTWVTGAVCFVGSIATAF